MSVHAEVLEAFRIFFQQPASEEQIELFMPVGEGLLLFPEAALRHRQVGQQVRSLS